MPQGKKRLYCVSGDVPALMRPIKEYTHAVSRRQAIFQVARKLEALYPTVRIYLGMCEVEEARQGDP